MRNLAPRFCLLLLPALVPSCQAGGEGRQWFARPKTSQQWLDQALESDRADERRKGVRGLAASRDGQSYWAMKVYVTVARCDRDASVRCAALSALGPVATSEHVPFLLELLNSPRGAKDPLRPAPGAVRWEAVKLLTQVLRREGCAPEQRAAVVQTLLERVADDDDRHVRIAGLEALAAFQDLSVLRALINALDYDDFALQHAAERSLVALTGVTHRHDADAWRRWLELTPDPFAHAGEIPADQRAERKSRWNWEWEY
jgi:hypothetical protein